MTQPVLFNYKTPPLSGPKGSGTSDYEYVSRSDRKEIIEIRNWWNKIFKECKLPRRRKMEIKQRVKSKNYEQHRGGIFELFVYKFFKEVGFSVHSGRNLSGRHPDFFLTAESGVRFHLEATCVLSEPSFAHGRGLNGFVRDLVRSLKSEKYRFLVDYRGHILELPSRNKLKSEMEKWLNSLDTNLIIENYLTNKDILSFPSKKFIDKKLSIKLTPLPRTIEKFSRGKSNIWGITSPAEHMTTDKSIYNKIREKARQCKSARLPAIIAMNLADITAGLDEVYDALFGKESTRLYLQNNKVVKTEQFRHGKGAFRFGKQTINTKITALLLFYGIHYDPLPRGKPILLLNPFRAIKDTKFAINHVKVIDPVKDEFTFPELQRELDKDWELSRNAWPLKLH